MGPLLSKNILIKKYSTIALHLMGSSQFSGWTDIQMILRPHYKMLLQEIWKIKSSGDSEEHRKGDILGEFLKSGPFPGMNVI